MLFGVNTPGGLWNILVLIPSKRAGGGLILNFGTPPIFGTAEARDLKFCMLIETWCPNENNAKLCHTGSRVLGPPRISRKFEAAELKFRVSIDGWGP